VHYDVKHGNKRFIRIESHEKDEDSQVSFEHCCELIAELVLLKLSQQHNTFLHIYSHENHKSIRSTKYSVIQ
jgi:hypothetical protein